MPFRGGRGLPAVADRAAYARQFGGALRISGLVCSFAGSFRARHQMRGPN